MDDRTKHLIEWVSKLPTNANPDNRELTLDDFTDGVVLGKVLEEIIDPKFFQEMDDVPLVKVVDKMKHYLVIHNGQQVPPELIPKCGKIITRGDAHEIGRVIQLLLGCAVKCPRKDDFIKLVMEMERMVQVTLLEAIDELLLKEKVSSPTREAEGTTELTGLQGRIEELSQENFELKGQLTNLEEDNITLTSLNHRLNAQLTSYKGELDNIQIAMKSSEGTKMDVKKLHEENEALEATCEEFERKIEDLENQLEKAHSRMDSRTNLTEEIIRLNDEIDILRESVAKSSEYESSIRTYKRRLEEMAVLKANVKVLEEKNEELNQANIRLQEEVRSVSGLKTKVGVIKLELAETQRRLSQETQRAMKAEFECRNLHEKHESVQKAATGFQEEKIRLAEQLEEMRFSADARGDKMSNDDLPIESLSPIVRQKILELEVANKKLNEDLNARIKSESIDEGSKVLVEQLRLSEEKLGQQLLLKSQELIDCQTMSSQEIRRLEAKLQEKEEQIGDLDGFVDVKMPNNAMVIQKSIPDSNIVEADPEGEKAQEIREREEKLMASVFYNLSMQIHRYGVQTRNTTFLERHRRPTDARRKF